MKIKPPISDFASAFALALFLALLLSCQNGPISPSYRPILPDLPGSWENLLGRAHWRLEWIDEAGVWQRKEMGPGDEMPEISLMQEWATPVLAWPYWPDLDPALMQPAGAIFPWDAEGDRLILGWKAGVEAFFWKELAAAERASTAAEGRLPWFFDWPRFRELLYVNGNIPEPVRANPWLADWKDIAQKTIRSGFDRRRILSRPFAEIAFTGLSGLWINSSPFAAPLYIPPGETLYLNVSEAADTWVSEFYILKCSDKGWVLRER